jgi:predicted nucleic acid-binding protein
VIVVDASALLEVLLQTDAAPAVEARLFGGGTLHAPHLLDVEVAQVLRRYERTGELSARRGREALEDLAAFRIERYPHHLFLPRVWALRANATAYDACYLALAEALAAPLLTMDRRLAAVPGHAATVEIPG